MRRVGLWGNLIWVWGLVLEEIVDDGDGWGNEGGGDGARGHWIYSDGVMGE